METAHSKARRVFTWLLLSAGFGAALSVNAQQPVVTKAETVAIQGLQEARADGSRALALARLEPAIQACPPLRATDQQGCRLQEIHASEQGQRLVALTSGMLDAPLGREAIGSFFSNVIPRCVFSRRDSLPEAWRELGPKFAQLLPGDVYRYVEKTESFPSYRRELQDRLLLDDRPETLEIADEIGRRPGGRRILGTFLEAALRLQRLDCRVLSANEQQVIRQVMQQLAR